MVFARTAANAPWSFVSHEFVKLDDTSPRDTVLAKKIDELYKSVAPEADEIVSAGGSESRSQRYGPVVSGHAQEGVGGRRVLCKYGLR